MWIRIMIIEECNSWVFGGNLVWIDKSDYKWDGCLYCVWLVIIGLMVDSMGLWKWWYLDKIDIIFDE